jgi:hypothetical protein
MAVRRRSLLAAWGTSGWGRSPVANQVCPFPEYDRALEQPNRSAAEHKVRAREQRHDELDPTPLSAQDQRRYSQEWTRLEAAFVEPSGAISAADALLNRVMRDRGYPTGEFDDRVQTLSVERARTSSTIGGRTTSRWPTCAARPAPSRQAVMQYRALASDLLDVEDLTPRRTASDHPNAQGSPMTYPPGPSGRSPSRGQQ